MKQPRNIALIDLGTNSVRFTVYEIGRDLTLKRLHREKRMVRLGDESFQGKRLAPAAMNRTLEALQEFSRQLKTLRVEQTIAISTAAMRQASNRSALCARILKETNISLQVISGEEEARLIAKGILRNEQTPKEVFSLIDIGGGSTEISLCRNRTLLDPVSLNLGANRLRQTHLGENEADQPPSQKQVAALRQTVRLELSRVIGSRHWPVVRDVIGSSGTIRAVRRILRKAGQPVNPFRRNHATELVDRLSRLSRHELLQIPGLEEKRADLIIPGSILLDETLHHLGASRVHVSEYALQDGLLEEAFEGLFDS